MFFTKLGISVKDLTFIISANYQIMGLVVSEDIFIANKQQELSRTAMLFAWSRTHTSMQILQGASKTLFRQRWITSEPVVSEMIKMWNFNGYELKAYTKWWQKPTSLKHGHV